METNPFTQTPQSINEPVPEVAMATDLVSNYVDSGAKKLNTVATIIGGETVGKILTKERITLAFALIGGVSTWNYLSKKGREQWKYFALGTVAIIGARYLMENKSGIPTQSTNTKS